MTAFISEFRSMTFQCKSAISSSIKFSEINSYIGRDRIMAPQQHDALVKSSEQLLHSEQTREKPVSPISSLGGTSMESSSPALPSDGAIENHQNFEMERSLVVDPSSDDSNSMANDLSGNQVELLSHLDKLQSTVGKVGRNGPDLHSSEYSEQKDDILNSSNASLSSVEQPYVYYDSNELYRCHLCTFLCNSEQEFNKHMEIHFDHKCPNCDYTSRTEGRLRRHVKDFHSETPPDSWAGTRVPRTEINSADQSMDDSVTSSNGKSRTYRCKQCDFVAYQKNEFWEHNKTHIKAEKLLSCPKCAFVTEYKHHLEYHLRNHFGSKPFKCTKCNYSCVNKSMLNSHMKSHSNIYQYRCTDCSYATKYCHSLKLHLRKYEHKPATVLNLDGTPNPYPVIDVYGTRRGPRTKKRRPHEDSENSSMSSTAVVTSQQSMNYSPAVPLLPPNVPMMYPHIFNSYQSNAFMKAHLDNSSYPMPHVRVKHDANSNCHMCEFTTDNHDTFQKHMILHAAAENQDIVKLYGINSDYLLHLQEQQMSFNNYMQSQRHYMEHLPRDERHNFDTHNMRERRAIQYEPEVRNIKHEEESVNYPEDVNRVSPRNDSRKESPTPTYRCNSASSSQHDKYEKDSSEDNERSVIVAHRSSPNAHRSSPNAHRSSPNAHRSSPNAHRSSPNAHRSSPNGVAELMDTQPPADKNVEHSPLDLSGPKLSDSGVYKSKIESSVEKQNPELTESSSPLGMNTPHIPSSIHRNRRKGKAFKIDHYIQVDDQPFQSEIPSKESDQSNNTELHKNGNINSHHEITPPSRQNNSQILEVSNSCISTEQPQNTQFRVMNSANNSSKSNYTPQNHRSLHESPNIFNGSFATLSEENNQQTHQRDFVGTCHSVPQPCQMPKVETDVQTDTAKKIYECNYCAMSFKDRVMFTLHKGYHGYADPFTCNMCGTESKDRVDFFIHIASAPHH